MNPRIEFWCSGEEAARAAVNLLSARGLHVVRSFDLQAAPAGASACNCPHHGTARCTCTYVVLLVYGDGGPPAVVTTHSCDSRTFLEIALDPNALPDASLVKEVQAALLSAESTRVQPASPASDSESQPHSSPDST